MAYIDSKELCNRAVVCDTQSMFKCLEVLPTSGITSTASHHALNNSLVMLIRQQQLNSIETDPRENEGVQPPAALSFLIPLSLHLSAHHADKSHYESGKPLNPFPQRNCGTSPRPTPTFQNWVSRRCRVFLR